MRIFFYNVNVFLSSFILTHRYNCFKSPHSIVYVDCANWLPNDMGAWVFFYLLPHLCLGWRCVRLVFLYLELWWSLMTSDNNRSIGNPKYRPTSFLVVYRNKPFDSKHLFLSLSLRVPNSALGVKSDSPIFWDTPFDYEDLFLVTCLCISLSRRKREMQQKITILVLREKKNRFAC